MKRIISLLLSLMMVFMASAALAETVEPITVEPGDTINLVVELESPSGRSAMIQIIPGTAPVTFKSAVGGSQAGDGYVNDVVPPQDFEDYFVVVNIQSVSLSKDGKTLSGSTGNGEFSLGNLEAGKVGLVTMTVSDTATAGTYTVETQTTGGVSTGSVTFIIEESESTGRLAGDANIDGEVDIKDARAIVRWLAGYDDVFSEANANCNGDDEVTVKDARHIIQWLAGYDVILQ